MRIEGHDADVDSVVGTAAADDDFVGVVGGGVVPHSAVERVRGDREDIVAGGSCDDRVAANHGQNQDTTSVVVVVVGGGDVVVVDDIRLGGKSWDERVRVSEGACLSRVRHTDGSHGCSS